MTVPNHWQQDVRVLETLVRIDAGEDAAMPADISPAGQVASFTRLHRSGHVAGAGINATGEVTYVMHVNERGLRATGAWPSEGRILSEVEAVLERMAEDVPEQEQSKIRSVLTYILTGGRDFAVDPAAAVAAHQLGS